MSAQDILQRHDLGALKAATRKLIGECGGGEGAAATIGSRQQHLSDCGNVRSGKFLRIEHVAALEMVVGKAPVTSAMCRLAGGVFVPLPHIGPAGAELMESTVTLASEMGDVSQTVITRFTDDGRIDGDDLDAINKEIDELVAAAERLRLSAKMLCNVNAGSDDDA